MADSDSELDYDDPRFLLAAETTASTSQSDLTYAERRKRTLAQQAERGRIKSRKQMEEEKREEGLSTNLIDRERKQEEAGGGASTAFKMMSKMGYKPGEALGRRYDSPASGSEAGQSGSSTPRTSGGGGLGFAKATFAPIGAATASTEGSPAKDGEDATPARGGIGSGPAGAAKTEPIRFEMRAARTGLGVPQAKRFRTYFSSSSSTDAAGNLDTSTAGDPLPDLQGYLARVKSSMDERRAYGLLRSLRRTCEELDRRAGIEDSPMWRDPDEEEREQQRVRNRKMFDRIDTELDSDDERKVTADSIKAEAKKAGRGELAYEIGTSETVVDSDSDSDEESAPAEQAAQAARPAEDPDEEAEVHAQIRARLALTLTYLRNKYHYCFWCGELYHDADDLKQHCPGTEEEEH
ncbi:hypothetical protein RHOSPDRAFT_36508 [Rhodotorula sp. JG-1b]|nr:hypothetical protein RHOSPDRAFT_36508 [Rhodotorula sp. JG-1b]